jgi:hypothetical protein
MVSYVKSSHDRVLPNLATPVYAIWNTENIVELKWAGIAQSVSDSLLAGRSEGQIPVGARSSTPIQTAGPTQPPVPHLYRLSFPGVKRPEHGVDTHPHLVPRSKKEQNYTSTSNWAFMASNRVNVTFIVALCVWVRVCVCVCVRVCVCVCVCVNVDWILLACQCTFLDCRCSLISSLSHKIAELKSEGIIRASGESFLGCR